MKLKLRLRYAYEWGSQRFQPAVEKIQGPPTRRLFKAVSRQQKTAIRELVKNVDIDQINDTGDTLLIHAVRVSKDRGIVQLVLNANPDVRKKNPLTGESALTVAIESGDGLKVQTLIAHVKNSTVRKLRSRKREDVRKWVSSIQARKRSPQLLEFVNEKDDEGETPLMKAARRGKVMAETLVRHGADLTARNADNDTVLMIAIRHGANETAKYFVDSGVDMQARNADNETAFTIAAKLGNRDIWHYMAIKSR